MNTPTHTRRGLRSLSALLIAALVVGASASVAFAITGSVAQARQVVFYYGERAGSGKSNNFSGYGTAKLCADAPGATSNQTFFVQYRRVRALSPDVTLKERDLAYSQARYLSASFSTSSANQHHTNVTWSAVPAANDAANGYSRAVGATC